MYMVKLRAIELYFYENISLILEILNEIMTIQITMRDELQLSNRTDSDD